MEVETFNEFDFYKQSSAFPENGVAVVVRKRPEHVLLYILEQGGLCVLSRQNANVGSVAEFDAKFELAEFYDISYFRVTKQNSFGQPSVEWVCTEDTFQPSQSDWMKSRVIVGGFVQVFVCCNFIDENLTKLDDSYWIVSTDLGPVLCEKAFITKQNDFYGTAVDLWATFVRESEGCHWQIFDADNVGSEAQAEKTINALCDNLHSETISSPNSFCNAPTSFCNVSTPLLQLEHAFDQFNEGLPPPTRCDCASQLTVSDKGDFTYTVDVSGFRLAEIEVKVLDNVLIINGEHHEQKYCESVDRKFMRQVLIPEGIMEENIMCGMNNGRLCIVGMKASGEGGR